jgi:hypothetical protein
MLETLDPANRLPAAPDDPARRPSEPAAAGPPRAAGRAESTLGEHRACDRLASPAESEKAITPWSSDWLKLSHELRTPLNAILGNIELLLDGSAGPLAAPARACVGDIQAASRQLLRQLQPLLLLVQVRTAEAPVAGLPIDLLALLRQAAADPAPGPDRCAAAGQDAVLRRSEPRLPEGRCLMVAGDPVWLGTLAGALLDLHAASPQAEEPLSITLERPPERLGDQPSCCARGVVLRASWPGLDAAAASPLPLALIDAVLALHGGRIRSLGPDGLRLDLPSARVVPSNPAQRGLR